MCSYFNVFRQIVMNFADDAKSFMLLHVSRNEWLDEKPDLIWWIKLPLLWNFNQRNYNKHTHIHEDNSLIELSPKMWFQEQLGSRNGFAKFDSERYLK